MSSDVVVRDIRPDDADVVAEIAVAAWEPIFAGSRSVMGDALFEMACPNWREDKARQVRSACEPDSSLSGLVVEIGSRVVGFVTFYVDARRVGELGNNAVHPDYQNHGIAQIYYQRAFERMRAMGARAVKVVTGGDAGHAPARRAYQKAGFEVAVPSVTYYREL